MRKWEKYMRGELYSDSPALRFGSLYDCLLLTPSEFPKQYAIVDEEVLCEGITARNKKATKEYKSRLAEFEKTAKANGQEVVPSELYDQALGMITRLDDEGLLDKVLSGGQPQVEFNEDLDGIPLKGFLDYDHPDYVLDSKSARPIDKFRYDVNSFCYDIQAYIYTQVTGKDEFYWLVQEKEAPYYPALVRCSEKTLFAGQMKFEEAVENIQEWLSTDQSEQSGYGKFEI
jgi:hypothetical protein